MTKQEFMAMSLPYDLKVKFITERIQCYSAVKYQAEFDAKIEVIKSTPILRPLSDLIKEILYKGKKIVPLSEILKDQRSDNNVQHLFRLILNCGMNEMCFILPFWVIQKLVEWHFDVAGLIEKGEAININTLPNNDEIYS